MSDSHDFFEVGDGYRASELFRVGEQYRINVTVTAVDDGSDQNDGDDTRVETDRGFFTATEMREYAEPLDVTLELCAVVWLPQTVSSDSPRRWAIADQAIATNDCRLARKDGNGWVYHPDEHACAAWVIPV